MQPHLLSRAAGFLDISSGFLIKQQAALLNLIPYKAQKQARAVRCRKRLSASRFEICQPETLNTAPAFTIEFCQIHTAQPTEIHGDFSKARGVPFSKAPAELLSALTRCDLFGLFKIRNLVILDEVRKKDQHGAILRRDHNLLFGHPDTP